MQYKSNQAKQQTDMHGKRAGFTIVELLIVIVVIAILATISIVAYNGIQKRALITTAKTELKNLSQKAEVFKVDNDRYPNNEPIYATLGA